MAFGSFIVRKDENGLYLSRVFNILKWIRRTLRMRNAGRAAMDGPAGRRLRNVMYGNLFLD